MIISPSRIHPPLQLYRRECHLSEHSRFPVSMLLHERAKTKPRPYLYGASDLSSLCGLKRKPANDIFLSFPDISVLLHSYIILYHMVPNLSLNLKYKILFLQAVPFASRLRSMLIATLSHCRLFENFMQEFPLSGMEDKQIYFLFRRARILWKMYRTGSTIKAVLIILSRVGTTS